MTPDELAKLRRGECPGAGHHVFSRRDVPYICQCGMVDTRNDPPRITCPMCGGEGDIEQPVSADAVDPHARTTTD